MFRTITILTTFFVITGCATMFKPEIRPAAPGDLPQAYTLYSSETSGPDRWWESFGSEELNRLMDEAMSNNFDIRTAWSRLKQADAVARQAGADLKPALTAQAGAEKSRLQTKTDDTDAQQTDTREFSAGLTASYEIDLWGRLSALRQSELLEYQAVAEDLETAAVTVAGEIVSTWINILSIRKQIAILMEQIDINQNLLKFQKMRFANGKATALDVSQQMEALVTAKAKLPMLQLTETRQVNALAVLLGRSGTENLSLTQQDLPDIIPVPKAGLPADLLAARPDVRAAGLRLESTDWQVSAARADRLPAITLSADAVFSSDSASLLFSNWVATLAAGITGPLFDGGTRSAEVDRQKALAEEYLAAYAQTVAQAVQEVEDCLATEKRQGEYIALLQDQLKASRLSLKDARVQYLNGQNNYLDYLTAWTSVQDLERQLVDEQATLITNRVDLYRTIGGDWSRDLAGNVTQSDHAESVDKDKEAINHPATAG